MINARVGLAAAVLAVGAGAVVFLSTNSPQAVGNVDGLGPVPVVPTPPVGLPAPVEPLRVVPAAVPPSSSAAPASTTPARQAAPPLSNPAGRAAPSAPKAPALPRRLAATPTPTPTVEQPRPDGVEPSGAGGWQLPACYNASCVAPMSAHETPRKRSDDSHGLLGDTLIVVTAPVLGLIGGLE